MSPRSVLVIAAHPDDEILGVGGTVRRHVLAGDTVHSVVVCEGSSMRYAEGEVPQEQYGRAAADILGNTVQFLRLPDQQLDTLPLTQIITPIEEAVAATQPQVVYTHFGGDINHDHRRIVEAVLVATRPQAPCIEAIRCFDTASSTEWGWQPRFAPDTYVDISETLEDKIAAMACYESELKPWPHPRSLEGLRHRAAYFGSLACMAAAEPFVTLRSYLRPGARL